MTDNDIKKALECCSYGSELKCQECPADDCSLSCGNKLAKQALDLINRKDAEIVQRQSEYETVRKSGLNWMNKCNELQAEIERLNKEIDRLSQCVMYHDGQIVDAKAEAVKAFAKKFEKKIKDVKFTIGQTWEIKCALKQTLQEMTEVKE